KLQSKLYSMALSMATKKVYVAALIVAALALTPPCFAIVLRDSRETNAEGGQDTASQPERSAPSRKRDVLFDLLD
ncbi:MAG TPA: hypothetical protein VEJ63_11585, partial [Planctomycetota bacterium]|nr:hypothetical protein [Planctomycetota bacterium]